VESVCWTISPPKQNFFSFDENSKPVCPGDEQAAGRWSAFDPVVVSETRTWSIYRLMYGAARLAALWKTAASSLRRLSSDFRRQRKVAFGLATVKCIEERRRSVLRREAADVIGMEVRDPKRGDFLRRVAALRRCPPNRPECCPNPTGPAPASRGFVLLPVVGD